MATLVRITDYLHTDVYNTTVGSCAIYPLGSDTTEVGLSVVAAVFSR
jgi:hypothetical protein